MTLLEALFLISIALPLIAAGALWVRIKKLALAVGIRSFGSDRAGTEVKVGEVIARVKQAAGPDGRIHCHDVEVIAKKVLRGV
jgi:hypothetical protein